MIDMKAFAPLGGNLADGTHAILSGKHRLVVGQRDSVSGAVSVVPTSILVSLVVSGHRGGSFIPMKFTVSGLLSAGADGALPSSAPFRDNIDLCKTTSTPRTAALGIDIGKPVLRTEDSGASPASVIRLDSDQSASGAVGPTVLQANVGKRMRVTSLLRGVSSDVANRFAFSPTPCSVVSRSNCGLASAATMASSEPDGTTVNTLAGVFHRKDYTPCSW